MTNLLERQTESLSHNGGVHSGITVRPTVQWQQMNINWPFGPYIRPIYLCKTHGKCMCFGGRGLVPMGTLFFITLRASREPEHLSLCLSIWARAWAFEPVPCWPFREPTQTDLTAISYFMSLEKYACHFHGTLTGLGDLQICSCWQVNLQVCVQSAGPCFTLKFSWWL